MIPAICHCYGTFTESKIVNLYRTSGISVMLYVCSVRCARCARYRYTFSGQSKRRIPVDNETWYAHKRGI